MLSLLIETEGLPARVLRIGRFPCRIGRSRDADVVLGGWRVARQHAELQRLEPGFRIVDAGTLAGTWVNGERVAEFGPLDERDEIVIAGHRLTIQPRHGGQRMSDGASAAAPALAVPRPDVAGSDEPAPNASTESAAEETLAAIELEWRRLFHRRLLQAIDLHRKDVRQLSSAQLRSEARVLLAELVEAEPALPDTIDRDRLIEDTLDEALGLGPLEALLADDTIGEIMVNGAHEIYVERAGLLELSALRFSDDDAVRAAIDRIVAPVGRRIDESSPMVDARLADGSRVNAVIPPLALRGPAITIRRFNRRLLSPQDLVDNGTLSPPMLEFLRLCVVHRRNIVVSGGTGSGKTTLLNVLSNLIPRGERVITIEDAAELRLAHPHLVALESRPSNVEGRGQVTIRELVRNALRMRPDRIVVGECRGGEALDMLQAMNTGHDGSLTTVHANSARDVLARLETMVLMAGIEIPVSAVREHVASAVDLVVHQARLPDGRRRVVEIAEFTGLESGRVLMQPLFRFVRGPAGGRFSGCGNVPQCMDALREQGASPDLSVFEEHGHDVD
ncbi:MAG: Flp pilus assembly complex ATPase component TadA [Limnobacter sp.]|nr:Flp pilus assembly complex ATPase component TadA [Limnobacter sp.]